jgi:hypothetical protein
MVAASWWSALKTMVSRAFRMTQRTATLAVWAGVLGRAGNNAPRASAACRAVVGSACPGNTRAHNCPKRGARCKRVVLVLRCARAEGAVRGVKDTVAMERGTGVCSAVSKDPEEYFDLLWCKAIPVHLWEWRLVTSIRRTVYRPPLATTRANLSWVSSYFLSCSANIWGCINEHWFFSLRATPTVSVFC